MTTVNVAINGFGRIGRLVLRRLLSAPSSDSGVKINCTLINDPNQTIDHAAYLLGHDSIHGKFQGTIEIQGADTLKIVIDSVVTMVQFAHFKDPAACPWNAAVVLECTGCFTSATACQPHIDGGASHVIISAPASADTPTYVVGVSAQDYKGERIVSMGSCTTNCLAPIAGFLDSNYGLIDGLMTTVHSATATQCVVDGPCRGGKDWRGGRAACNNIIPSSTGAAKAIGLVLPRLAGRITGLAFRVPTLDVSVLDLTVRLERAPESITSLIKDIEAATAKGSLMHGILAVTHEPLVSSDFIGDDRSCVIDAGSCMKMGSLFKIVAFYDNEMAFSCRLLDLAVLMIGHGSGAVSKP